MTIPTTDRELLQHLVALVCICGSPKKTRISHCRTCYYTLNEGQRRALYRKIGHGYREAFAESVVTLREKGRIHSAG